ncbi:MAG TPA: Fic family protein [Sedimentisphaerales bacterium]|nr:Fic family protein [Sedimentisphaerales bacterium]
MKQTGTYIKASTAGESFQAFVPHPLPPDPPLELAEQDHDLIEKANRALGRLDGVATQLPDVSLFLYFYVRKEAVLSSQIEGTQSSFSDLLLHEENLAPGVPLGDVQEVSNYVAAMNHGLKRLREDDFPLSLRLIREMHEVLLAKGRGSDKTPGRFRRSQNWLGGTRPGNARFVPPPPDHVADCMSNLEKFFHDQPQRTPALIKAALAHVQFETIHPFLDGNGRLGRLLITLILCAEEAIAQPLLYLSLFFKQHRQEYYDRLDAVRLKGDWLGWLRFFLEGVEQTAQQAADTAGRILRLFEEDRRRVEGLGRKANSAQRVLDLLRRHPITTISNAMAPLNLTAPTIRSAVEGLEALRIVREITGKQRDRIYLYDQYVRILDEGTEPLP